MQVFDIMKTIAKINPEKEYEIAKMLIETSTNKVFDPEKADSLGNSIENLITVTRILIEREERRRGKSKPPKKDSIKGRKKGQDRQESKKLPSERFPDIPIKEEILGKDTIPECPCCKMPMKDSGLYDTSEKLEVVPKKYFIIRTKRLKYNCGKCYGSLVNTPAKASIIPLSNYGDSICIDVSLSKFCDLIPIERYCQMAYRSGLENLPPQSMIGLTHYVAEFLSIVYLKIKLEVLAAIVLQADETIHKMLEGDDTRNWYLWGFKSLTSCYFEVHNTRSGNVAKEFLKESKAIYLLTDGYSGYDKAIREIKEELGREIIPSGCNSHSLRYFKDAAVTWEEESALFLDLYKKIYELERKRKEDVPKEDLQSQLNLRKKMIPIFEEIKKECEEKKLKVMAKSSIEKGISYFLNQYPRLIKCTEDIQIPLDNNSIEREFRPPVVGRKTWYGTHSKRGAKTAAVHFTIIRSCHLSGVNPRNYYPWVVKQIHSGGEILTPFEYSKLHL